MRHTEPDPNGLSDLLRENEELKRQLEALKSSNGHTSAHRAAWRPSATAIWAIFLFAVVLVVVAFLAGYRPLVARRNLIAAESHEEETALQKVKTVEVKRSHDPHAIELPGNVQAITEAPILARADGYLQKRLVDIGD